METGKQTDPGLKETCPEKGGRTAEGSTCPEKGDREAEERICTGKGGKAAERSVWPEKEKNKDPGSMFIAA